jgi:hypothetical protein
MVAAFDAGGAPVFGPLNAGAGTEPVVASSVAVADNGDALVAWHGAWTGDTGDVFARRFDSAGTALVAPARMNTAPVEEFGGLAIAAHGPGAIVTWLDGDWQTLLARSLAGGSPSGAPIPVGAGAQGWPAVEAGAIAAGGEDSFLMAWTCGARPYFVCGRFFSQAVEPPPAPQVEAPLGNTEVAGAIGRVVLLGLLAGAALRRRRR